ncbi:molybdopterin cofactor biosynthetic protein [Talaromyces stipitatus ATCC 10500]|uniref:Molybdopterin cofactor biosynthetic protein n=1 Tax=Talaromyces stipitatus (strain ATCC 10500 / CBS 375.48 / QM 6759 / NRRL 1006) TaxID=441959 RepID=B8M0P6_TALSN|nr:molybdopterin cofactor biosynthetic protein [Talaromyces stipitatus ATCC 10500]EED21429.1 molybdopterin cofactor biosynthetic protein [Talaromyces stipitatus ATCC 10500]
MAGPSVLRRSVSHMCYTSELPRLRYSGRYTVTHRHLRRQHSTAAVTVEERSPLTTAESTSSPTSPRAEAIKTAKPFSEFLTDTFHRQHDYLRISVTEKCNLRCLYCMPEEGVPLSPPAHLLTTPEIVYLSSLFVSQGVTKIRLTGGEPTVRKDIVPMMQSIGDLRKDGLRELCLTTNGISLHRKLDAMTEAGLTGVNLSLDTLDPFKYQIMTRRNGFEAVMKSINRIEEMNCSFNAGIKLKINCVVMRGLNEHEIVPFVEMGREKDIEVRFIEYMPFDGNKWSAKKMVPYQEMLDIIRKSYPSLEKVADHKNDTSKTYRVPGFQGKVGFITSMTHNFCGTCNRLRITSDGNLKVCLHGNAEVSLRDLIREKNNGLPINDDTMEALDLLESGRLTARIQAEKNLSDRERRLLDVIGMAVKRKKAKHAGIGKLENMKNRPMILIDNSILQFKHRTRMNTVYSTLVPTHLVTSSTHPLRTYTQHIRNSSTKKSKENQTAHEVKPNHPVLPHLNTAGHMHMTNVGRKPSTQRYARATCLIHFTNDITYTTLTQTNSDCSSTGGTMTLAKGDVFAAARVAGIMAAKKTPDIVPLCHPSIGIDSVSVDINLLGPDTSGSKKEEEGNKFGAVEVIATVTCEGRTGVEMEAMTAVMGAALTVYDMCKANDKGIVIDQVRLLEKRGGKSGIWKRDI